ncbi:hypothetical protein ES703_117816 [subsurface metagenome]
MSLEELLIEADVFDCFYAFIAFDFDHFIDEKEWKSVRQDFCDLPNIKDCIGSGFLNSFCCFSRFKQFFYEPLIKGMPAFIGYYSSLQSSSDEGEVAEQIDYFVSDAFVRKVEAVFDRPV